MYQYLPGIHEFIFAVHILAIILQLWPEIPLISINKTPLKN